MTSCHCLGASRQFYHGWPPWSPSPWNDPHHPPSALLVEPPAVEVLHTKALILALRRIGLRWKGGGRPPRHPPGSRTPRTTRSPPPWPGLDTTLAVLVSPGLIYSLLLGFCRLHLLYQGFTLHFDFAVVTNLRKGVSHMGGCEVGGTRAEVLNSLMTVRAGAPQACCSVVVPGGRSAAILTLTIRACRRQPKFIL